jgi:hypothetical protein
MPSESNGNLLKYCPMARQLKEIPNNNNMALFSIIMVLKLITILK